MKLSKFLRGASPASEAQPRRRRRTPRADGPRTIIPVDDATPSWLHTAPAEASPFELNVDAARERQLAPQPFELRIDEARSRLRRAIPPVADDE